MKVKRILVFILLIAVLAVLAACAGGTDTPADTGPAQPPPQQQETGQAGQEAAVADDGRLLPTPPGQFPVVPPGTDVTVTVTVMQTPFIDDHATNFLIRYIQEKTGVNLEFIAIPEEMASERILLTLSTNDIDNLPDAFFARPGGAGDTIFMPSFAPRWYQEGLIIPLNDLIDEWGYYTLQGFDMALGHGYRIREWMTSADGNIYSLPGFTAALTNAYPHKLWINQGWLNELNLDMPRTTDEFRDTLRAFRDRDPNAIPFSGAAQHLNYGYDPIINAFIYNHTAFSRMFVENGVVNFAPIQPEWREAMQFLRELHDEGLYFAGSFTQDLTALRQIATNENDILGAFEALGHNIVVVTDDPYVIDRFTHMPVLVGPNGKHYVTYTAPTPTANGVITARAEHPEIVFRVLDAFMSHEAAMITRYGERGVNWDVAEPGTYSFFGTPALYRVMEVVWSVPGQNQHMQQHSPFILNPDVVTGIQWDGNTRASGFLNAQSVMTLQETGVVPSEFIANLAFTMEEISAINVPRVDIDQFVLQSIANFVAGAWDPFDDNQWDSYVAEFDRMGLPIFLETVQTAFSR